MDERAPDLPPGTIDWVERLHALVDEAAAPVLRANARRLQCRAGCSDCCADGLTVFEIEAAVIRRHHAELLQTGEPSARAGACAFLDGANFESQLSGGEQAYDRARRAIHDRLVSTNRGASEPWTDA